MLFKQFLIMTPSVVNIELKKVFILISYMPLIILKVATKSLLTRLLSKWDNPKLFQTKNEISSHRPVCIQYGKNWGLKSRLECQQAFSKTAKSEPGQLSAIVTVSETCNLFIQWRLKTHRIFNLQKLLANNLLQTLLQVVEVDASVEGIYV